MNITVGYRCKIKENSSFDEYIGHDVIIRKFDYPSFGAVVLKKGTVELLKENIVVDEIAWLEEDELELVNKNISENMEFYAWWLQVKEYKCPDCGHLCWNETNGKHTLIKDDYGDLACPKCLCGLI